MDDREMVEVEVEDSDGIELSDEQLEKVTGGTSTIELPEDDSFGAKAAKKTE